MKERCILIVDDDLSARLLLKVQLKPFGYRLVEAADGLEAVEVFQRERPDLILMDIDMPRMDGYEAAQAIRALNETCYVPILFLTALDDERALLRTTEVGGDDFMAKPVTPIHLESRIRSALGRAAMYHRLRDQHRALERQRLQDERDQQMAREIFARITRLDLLDQAGIEYEATPLMVFSGDLLLARRTPWGALRVMLGDFTGHGLPAAVGCLPTAEIFYGMTKKGFHVSELVAELNRKLYRILPRGIFCAAAVIELDSKSRHITVWNGGLPRLLLVDSAGGGRRKHFDSTHLALGILDPDHFDAGTEQYPVRPQDSLIAYTDGVIETENPQGDLYGEHRLKEALRRDGASCFQRIRQDLAQFRAGADQFDDYTLIEIPCALENQAPEESQPWQQPQQAPGRWRQQLCLETDSLARVDPVPLLLQGLMHIQGLDSFREDLFTILSELYVNALDHGILGLDSSLKQDAGGFTEYLEQRNRRLASLKAGKIHIDLQHEPTASGGRLTISVEDSGPGFDLSKLPGQDCNARSGRGICLVRKLCESLEYHKDGRLARAVYIWQRHPAESAAPDQHADQACNC
ncbi:MAG TPA: response regulator [Gammaproteobacteria bacterium]|nr:response regulator [Gammaproteobacteria bacterium]